MKTSKDVLMLTEKIDGLTELVDLLYVLNHLLDRLNSFDSFVMSKGARSNMILGTKRLVSFVTGGRYYDFHFKDGSKVQFTSRMGKRITQELNKKEYVCIKRGKYVSTYCVEAICDNMVYLTDKSCHFMSKKGKERLEKSLKECYHGASKIIRRDDDDK